MSQETTLADREDREDEDSISLLDIAITLGEEKKWIAIITATITAITAVVSLLLTPMFTAKTTFIVPNPSAGASAAQALANLGGLMGSGGGAAALLSGGKSPDEMYMEFLKTKSMANNLIKQFDLQKRFDKNSLEQTQKELRNRTKIITLKKAGLISVEVEDEDPKFAAELANAYVVNLKKLLENFAGTESQMRKEFYEKELMRAKKELQGTSDYRDMKVRESVIAVLTNQYEVAVLDAARESLIQVSEKASPPEKKSFPKRGLMVMVSAIGGLLFSILFVLAKRSLKNAQHNPLEASRWQHLKAAWGLNTRRTGK